MSDAKAPVANEATAVDSARILDELATTETHLHRAAEILTAATA